MAVLGLRFCARALSSCGKWGPLFIAMRGPLTITASPAAEHRLQTRRLSNCGSRAQPLRGMWDPPRPGLEPVSPALAGRFSTTAPPGKPYIDFCSCNSLIFIVIYYSDYRCSYLFISIYNWWAFRVIPIFCCKNSTKSTCICFPDEYVQEFFIYVYMHTYIYII